MTRRNRPVSTGDTFVRLPEGFSLSDVYVIHKYRAGLHLTHSCAAFRLDDDGELHPAAHCDVCQADTIRCADGTCSPCESREPYTRAELDESVTHMERRPA